MSEGLYYELIKAHDVAATAQPNGSLQVALTVYQASGSMTSALAAASLAQGELHAPIDKARLVLNGGPNVVHLYLDYNRKVPGFGNSFYKAPDYPHGDPAFKAVGELLAKDYPELCKVVLAIREANPRLPPANAAMYTAMVMEALNIPVGMGAAIFISARVKAWAQYLLEHGNA